MSSTPPIDRAVAAVGGEDAFLSAMKIKRRTLFYWKAGRLPLERVPEIARVSGLPLHELRPDLWPAPAEVAA